MKIENLAVRPLSVGEMCWHRYMVPSKTKEYDSTSVEYMLRKSPYTSGGTKRIFSHTRKGERERDSRCYIHWSSASNTTTTTTTTTTGVGFCAAYFRIIQETFNIEEGWTQQ
eukprot:GHVS01076565.1.p2 GENE.GHVS01076565.1~~GHVS01076565.1.p2  ORF type:complete len:112 (-),score=20.20 GHVS01076565.1:78-413(-)